MSETPPSPQFLYVLRAKRLQMLTEGPSPEEAEILAAHGQYLDSLADSGTAILYGRTQNLDETTFGLVIFRADSEQAAGAIMEDDPGVKGGLMTAQLFPFGIVRMRS